jgi:hypothetical protein
MYNINNLSIFLSLFYDFIFFYKSFKIFRILDLILLNKNNIFIENT